LTLLTFGCPSYETRLPSTTEIAPPKITGWIRPWLPESSTRSI